MSADRYIREKLSTALDSLITNRDIRTRVEGAFLSLIAVNDDDLSDPENRERYRKLMERVTAREAEHEGEGRIRATLRNMTEEEVAGVASEIKEIHDKLLWDLAGDHLV
ncbi:hypothetical protein EHS39_23720 [Ensifer sp. MPMI2T]|nr:hypothetical protein EHS39_23720 [Ensifer sp. MPMI2T]